MLTYSHRETAVDTLNGHTPSGHTLSMPAPLATTVARCARCLCAARCLSAVCRLCERCVLLFFARVVCCVCFVALWWSASTCSSKSNDATQKSSLVENTHANYFFFMEAYIAKPRCRLETRFARKIIYPSLRYYIKPTTYALIATRHHFSSSEINLQKMLFMLVRPTFASSHRLSTCKNMLLLTLWNYSRPRGVNDLYPSRGHAST